jgi:hypothetical protein
MIAGYGPWRLALRSRVGLTGVFERSGRPIHLLARCAHERHLVYPSVEALF